MAVLVEAISVIVRLQAIASRYEGGWTSFIEDVPNRSLCSDNELVRVGFMIPDDCKAFVDGLNRKGIPFENGAGPDVVIAEQLHGITTASQWAEFGQVELKRGQVVSAVRLRGSSSKQVFCPEGWTYEGSLSEQFGFVPSGHDDKSLKFLRHEEGSDVYLNLMTGKEVYIGRTGGRGR
jgi:hypothetical protein